LKPVADIWLNHPNRRQFIRGVIFDPSGRPVPEGTLNLWQGFATQPRQGSWERLRIHIRDMICRGNRVHHEYLIRWLARMVQHPDEQGEVAVVMRGAEGTGKGTLARAMKRILGQHALAISNSKHLTGNFNAHLRDCVFLFADEAFFAGDRQHLGVLKAIITEPYLTVEGKYQNAVQVPNFLHLMMASNEEWVVPASLEARRFLVLEVDDAHKDDHAWFAAIWEEMEAGGYEAMLHDLMQINLTTFNVRRVRGHAAEFGIIAATGAAKVGVLFAAIEQQPDIPSVAMEMFTLFGQQIDDINARIAELDARLNASHKANPVSQRLATIPGVGPITALTLAIEIDPAQFESGRHLAAWAGLTPQEHSTGGKQRMGGISRAGNERLRALLVAGATSVIQAASKPGSRQMTEWLRALLARKPRKLAAVALANKTARIAWALMTSGETYRRDAAVARHS
jgi:hypothetical protein